MKSLFFLSLLSLFFVGSSFRTVKDTRGIIDLPSGTVTISTPIVLSSGQILQGHDTTLVLADGANCPIIIVGGLDMEPSEETYGVIVKDITINGNKENQTTETWNGEDNYIRNNGITIRRARNVLVTNVVVSNCRSGGIVLEKGCEKIAIVSSSSNNNFFDGLAAYKTNQSLFSKLELSGNEASGASFDLDFNGNLISNSILKDNKSHGIFMRDSNKNSFKNILIQGSGRQGVFIAKSDLDNSICKNNYFEISFFGNKSDWIVNDEECVGNIFEKELLTVSQ